MPGEPRDPVLPELVLGRPVYCYVTQGTVLTLYVTGCSPGRALYGRLQPPVKPCTSMCVPTGGGVGAGCGRGARDAVLSTPYASPLPPAGANIPSWPGLGALYVYVLCACRPAVGSCGPPARARLPLAGGRPQNETGVVGVPTQGVQSGQLVVSYLLNLRPTTTTSVRWRGGLSVSADLELKVTELLSERTNRTFSI